MDLARWPRRRPTWPDGSAAARSRLPRPLPRPPSRDRRRYPCDHVAAAQFAEFQGAQTEPPLSTGVRLNACSLLSSEARSSMVSDSWWARRSLAVEIRPAGKAKAAGRSGFLRFGDDGGPVLVFTRSAAALTAQVAKRAGERADRAMPSLLRRDPGNGTRRRQHSSMLRRHNGVPTSGGASGQERVGGGLFGVLRVRRHSLRSWRDCRMPDAAASGDSAL